MTQAQLKKYLPLFALAITGGFFLALEVVCALVEDKDRLTQIHDVLREDSALLWTQRSGLDTEFFGGRTHTGELGLRETTGAPAGEELRVLILGESPTFGWGVHDEETYASVVQARLEQDFPGKIRVINGAGIGYSSHQGLEFLRAHVAELAPHVVTVPFVINDVDNYRFYSNNGLTDRETVPPSTGVAMLRNFAARSAFCRTLGKMIARASSLRAAGDDYSILPGKNRVPVQDYRENLRAFQELATAHNFRLIFLKMPVNLPLGPEVVSSADAEKALALGIAAAKSGDCAAAEPHFKTAVAADATLSEAYYHWGRCAARSGELSRADALYLQVKQSENHRCAREALAYNEVMVEVAAERATPIVDVVAAFRDPPQYLFVDEKLDTYHPNRFGHALIAGALYDVLLPILRTKTHTAQVSEDEQHGG